ncbi:DUF5937 family protein [Streptomyces sp. NPDC002018]|uniref:DUF5937 family protein n=1 Tax=Streptomyces sp. NPDC002018 TaxID=3364629 RepID=UPI003678574F
MLRFHFTAEDLMRTRVAAASHPLWEIASSLHRFQTRRGRWAYVHWYRIARAELQESGLHSAVKTFLLPLFPRASYFPDFLTPMQGTEGLGAGLDAILSTPRRQVDQEIAMLARVNGIPAWAPRLAEGEIRNQLVEVLGAYHRAVIAPHEEDIHKRLEAERIRHARSLLDTGVEGMLNNLTPTIRWRHPVLEVDYYGDERDVHLNGRGLLLIPSYFCWNDPISLADPGLPPVLMYPLHHASVTPHDANDKRSTPPLHALLGRTRATILRSTATGATTTGAARYAGVSAGTATHHTTALRDAGLITSNRHANTVLHTLTPLGAALLEEADRAAGNR